MRKDFSKLRESLDGNDSFVSGGHQIIKTAGATLHAERMLRVPVWALDSEKVKQILLTVFPKLQTDESQRLRAGRWAQIINLYYRVGLTRNMIAEDTGMSISAVKSALIRIKKAAEGKQSPGGGRQANTPRGQRPRGRPKMAHP